MTLKGCGEKKKGLLGKIMDIKIKPQCRRNSSNKEITALNSDLIEALVWESLTEQTDKSLGESRFSS